MVGTIVDYSFDGVYFVKILSGEEVFILYPKEQLEIMIGNQVEFDIITGKIIIS